MIRADPGKAGFTVSRDLCSLGKALARYAHLMSQAVTALADEAPRRRDHRLRWLSTRGASRPPNNARQLNPQRIHFGAPSVRTTPSLQSELGSAPRRGRAISEMLDAGVDIATVQRLVGHASPTTTSNYDRRPERAKADAVNRVHVPLCGTSGGR